MRVVLDANVIISALASPIGVCSMVLTAMMEIEPWTLVMSRDIEAELKDCLTRPKILKLINQTESQALLWLEKLMSASLIVNDEGIRPQICRDPKDNKYIGAAFAGDAKFLVTGDRDLLELANNSDKLIITPRRFLVILGLEERWNTKS